MSKCPKCNGTGMADSGGTQPWGEPIEIECDCMMEEVKMTSREQFNEWFYEYTGCNPKDSRYVNMVEMYWMAWQASSAAIEIELPDIEDKKWHSSWHGKFRDEAFWLETRRVLNGHGIKVKK